MRGNVIPGRAPLARRGVGIGIGEMPAKAITAMHRAGARQCEQDAATIFVNHPGRAHGGGVADGISAEARHGAVFIGGRQDLQQQGIARIALAHARDIFVRHAHGERRDRGGHGLPGQTEGLQ